MPKWILPLMVIVSLVIRYSLLELFPVASTDLNRNLLFGHLLFDGFDPYSTTGAEVLTLVQSGEIDLLVPYTSAWNQRAYDYPSIAIYFFSGVVYLSKTTGIDPFFLAKFLLSIVDITSGILIYLIIHRQTKYSEQFAIKAALIYMINPISIFQVSLEGQFEGITTLFSLLAIYYALAAYNSQNSNRGSLANYESLLSGVFLGFGFLTKYYPILLLISFFILFFRMPTKILNLIIGVSLSIFIFSLPFIFSGAYIVNFLEFQSVRNDTAGLSFELNTLGYQVALNFLALIIFGGFALFSILKGHIQSSIISLSSFFLVFFVLTGNSLFPWYLIMMFAALPLARSEFFPSTNILAWSFVIVFYQIVWYNDPVHISLVVITTLVGVGISLFTGVESDERLLHRSTRTSPIFTLLEKLQQRPKIVLSLLIVSIGGIIAPYTGLDHDINVWISVAEESLRGVNPYITAKTTEEYYAYPPIWMYILTIFYNIGQSISLEFTEFTARFFIKVPLIVGIVCTAYVVDFYIRTEGVSEKTRLTVFAMICLNPLIFVISAMWGMFDILVALCTVTALLFLRKSMKDPEQLFYVVLTSLFASLAALLKIYPIILFPLFFLLIPRIKNKILFLMVYFLLLFVGSLPYILTTPSEYFSILFFHSGRIGGGVTYWNYFWLLISRGDLSVAQAASIMSPVSYILLFLGLAIVYLLTILNKFSEPVTPTLLVILVFMMTFKLILEQYIVWLLPVLILWIAMYETEKNSVGVSLLAFILVILITIVPLLYLILSVPLTDLFYLDFIREMGEPLKSIRFEVLQRILFFLGVIFTLSCTITATVVYNRGNT